ncbi:hypothetical protein [Rhodohalobacter sp. SW132]|uniref:hypothetical protein n=1 Tax=Rhodohalobacter sp. SW132 TaxID=2293433 RepID=UPI0011C07820|nr:hypothetical protein [Rhodohalobacter sp. SW132]
MSQDSYADAIEDRFQDLVLSYQSKMYTSDQTDKTLPQIEDGDRRISGEKEIEQWLIKLEDELKWQRSLSGDGCYIDPESGNVC